VSARVRAFRVDRGSDELDERFEQVLLRLEELLGLEGHRGRAGERADEIHQLALDARALRADQREHAEELAPAVRKRRDDQRRALVPGRGEQGVEVGDRRVAAPHRESARAACADRFPHRVARGVVRDRYRPQRRGVRRAAAQTQRRRGQDGPVVRGEIERAAVGARRGG